LTREETKAMLKNSGDEIITMKKSAQRGAGCSKAEPNIFARRRPLPGGAGRPKFNQLEMVMSWPLPTNRVW